MTEQQLAELRAEAARGQSEFGLLFRDHKPAKGKALERIVETQTGLKRRRLWFIPLETEKRFRRRAIEALGGVTR